MEGEDGGRAVCETQGVLCGPEGFHVSNSLLDTED
jgi:hypothetical protein